MVHGLFYKIANIFIINLRKLCQLYCINSALASLYLYLLPLASILPLGSPNQFGKLTVNLSQGWPNCIRSNFFCRVHPLISARSAWWPQYLIALITSPFPFFISCIFFSFLHPLISASRARAALRVGNDSEYSSMTGLRIFV